MGLSTTEKIVSWAAKKAFDKAVGGYAPIISSYHKLHFIFLARALKEWSRDKQLQDAINKIKGNLERMRSDGAKFLRAIPDTPKPPVFETDQGDDPAHRAQFSADTEAFIKGVNHVRRALMDHIKVTDDLIARSKRDLGTIEKKLKDQNSRLSSMRQISNLARLQDVQWVKFRALSALQRHANAARTKLKAYNNI
ncbi:MAG: hypothetical protein AAGC57_02110 [Pseudomonadota bacterium]